MAKLLSVIIVSLAIAGAAAGEPNAFEINKIVNRGINFGNALECRKKATGALPSKCNILTSPEKPGLLHSASPFAGPPTQ